MSIHHVPGKGQHTIVRIEHTSWPGDAVRVAQFEDSDTNENDYFAGVGWCIRWALDGLLSGSHECAARELVDALGEIEECDPEWFRDETERRLMKTIMDAAVELSSYKASKRQESKRTKKKPR
jgi:hypothetical protein